MTLANPLIEPNIGDFGLIETLETMADVGCNTGRGSLISSLALQQSQLTVNGNTKDFEEFTKVSSISYNAEEEIKHIQE